MSNQSNPEGLIHKLFEQIEARHGGKRLRVMKKKYRWKAPLSMTHGNTVNCVPNSDGELTVWATGRAAEAVREILGDEQSIKLIGRTKYPIWLLTSTDASSR
jgi:hypothetical protein